MVAAVDFAPRASTMTVEIAARSRQHRHAERHDYRCRPSGSLCRLDSGLALLAAARLDHVEGVEANEHTPRDF